MKLLFFLSIFLLVPISGNAYIDPGTTGSVLSSLGAMLPAIVAFFGLLLGFLFRPIKLLLRSARKRREVPVNEASVASEDSKT